MRGQDARRGGPPSRGTRSRRVAGPSGPRWCCPRGRRSAGSSCISTLPSRPDIVDGETVHTGRITRRTLLRRERRAARRRRGRQARRLTPKQARALRAAVRGRVYAPGDSTATTPRASSSTAATTASGRPPSSRCATPPTCAPSSRWADRYDVPLVARSGGHGYNGNSTSATAVVVDLERARPHLATRDGTRHDRARRAHARDVYAALARHGVTIPAGSCPTVAHRRARARRRDGARRPRVRPHARPRDELRRRHRGRRRRRVDDDDDLFWALRGGGGSFAIVTAVRLRTRRVTSAAFFRITYPRGARDEALHAWDAFAPGRARAR